MKGKPGEVNPRGGVVAFFPEKNAKGEALMTSEDIKKKKLGSVKPKEDFILVTKVKKIRSGGVIVKTKNIERAEKLMSNIGRWHQRF